MYTLDSITWKNGSEFLLMPIKCLKIHIEGPSVYVKEFVLTGKVLCLPILILPRETSSGSTLLTYRWKCFSRKTLYLEEALDVALKVSVKELWRQKQFSQLSWAARFGLKKACLYKLMNGVSYTTHHVQNVLEYDKPLPGTSKKFISTVCTVTRKLSELKREEAHQTLFLLRWNI